ncbi:hypothetical protein [Oerskovia sp. KBS0722]|uniref:hypothetical protein n=1 Tax=Oerskovia sp. KBS0722 TaxID=1179673 RepID=UPI00110E2190|nr:hypothetical protein [Oerskovia sp. KBS0722]QDW61960.1 hypothetical protein FFI11_004930 [Oerskovia sp. KBS0722]
MSEEPDATGDQVIDRLFALPLDEFVAARNAAAKQATAGGDAVGAARLSALTKPTVAAWVVNQVARAHPEEVGSLVALGDDLRAATEARDRARLTELDRDRRGQVEALVRDVSAAGEVRGRAVSGEVLRRLGETLTAAVMDRDAGALVQAGRLTQALQYVGFGIVDESGESADVVSLSAEREARRGTGMRSRAAEQRAEEAPALAPEHSGSDTPLADAEREVAAAAAEIDRLEGRRDQAADVVREASDAVGPLDARLSALDEQITRLTAERDDTLAALDGARSALAAAEEDLAAVDRDLEDAEGEAEEARRRRRAARAKG